MRPNVRLLLAILCLVFSTAPLAAKDDTWAQTGVWYQPTPVGTPDEAANTITNLARFFVAYGGAQVDQFVVMREGIAVATTSYSVQQNSQYVPSYGGTWIGNRYVPTYGGATVTTQTPVTQKGQGWLGFTDLDGIYLSFHPNLQLKWGVNFVDSNGTVRTIRTSEPALARKMADAAMTLAVEVNPGALAYAKIGLNTRELDKKDRKRLKWDQPGILVTDVWIISPAEAGGLQKDDIIVEVDGIPITGKEVYIGLIASTMQDKAEHEFTYKVFRAGQFTELHVTGKNAHVAYEESRQANPPTLGIRIREARTEDAAKAGLAMPRGVVVEQVLDKSPAKRLDIRVGDLLLEVNGAPVANPAEVVQRIKYGPVGSVKVWRNNTLIELRVAPASERLGISVRDLAADEPARAKGAGVEVLGVESHSPAAALDFRIGDLLVEVNGRPVPDAAALRTLLEKGPVTKAKVLRGGKLVDLTMVTNL